MAERVLVTGGSGFVGSHLVHRLVEAGVDVSVLVRGASDLWRIQDVLDRVHVVRGDDPLPATDAVYNLAAAGVRPGGDPIETAETNLLLTLRLLEHARAGGVERFVQCGSCFEYGPGERLGEDAPLRPISDYGASKAGASLLGLGYHRTYGLPVTVARPFTAYGPFEAGYRLVPSTVLAALDSKPIELTSGGQSRDFVYVDDAVDGLLQAGRAAAAVGETFNLCTGVATTVAGVAAAVARIVGDVEVITGAIPDRAVEFATLSGDPRRAADVLGWRARTSLADGLALTVHWFGEQRDRFPEYAGSRSRR